jgi:hypothetical protein
MGAGYIATCRAAVANPRSIGKVAQPASATDRARLTGFCIGSTATPADNAIQWTLQRITTAGTFTSVTPAIKDDPADGAATMVAGENCTSEPTYTASTELFDTGINQRANFLMIYAPGREPVIPKTNNAGLGVKSTHASATPSVDVVLEWDE